MLLEAATLALIALIAARFFLGRNLLAYPLTIALLMLLSSISLPAAEPPCRSPRRTPIGEIVVAAALVPWIAAPAEKAET